MFFSLEYNIYKLYLIKIAHWFLLIMPVIFLFYSSNNLTTQDLFTIQAVYSVAMVLLEIPSGYFADVIGRKITLIIGAVLGVCGYLIYSTTSGYWHFLFAELILGIGASFISGTDSAMLYDTLILLRREKDYTKMEGRVTSIGSFAEAIAGVLGGLLALVSLRAPFIAQTCIAFLAIPAALTVIEPSREKPKSMHSPYKAILDVVRNCLLRDKLLRRNIFYSSIIGASTLTMAWFVQPYFKEIDLPIGVYGIAWSILNGLVAISAFFAYRIEKRFTERQVITGILVFILIGYLGIGIFSSFWALGFLILFYLTRGIATPVLKDYINRLTTSDVRATVLSVRNLIIRLIFSSFAPLFGYLSKRINLSTALIIAGSTYFVIGGIVLLVYYFDKKD